ncbi:Sulfatase [Croceitalea dokdonensis DOKDO 023]|uniref:Sulfatase n=2 Tax=Croceitalea TaxID=574891 RepID=A0A0N8H3G4_9FLAO|nr:Sulfatase [Croceitalea dokdonensis DOKDO 023]
MNIMKRTLLLTTLFISLFSCKQDEKKETKKANTKPNIVYILTDQWRGDALGYAGDPNVKTPNLDQFAKESVNFTNAISVAPVCTPHRAALLTGKFPTTTGMFVNDLYLPKEEVTMAEIFKGAGYKTGFWGKWHLDGHGRSTYIPGERRQGFEYWKGLECSHAYNKMPYYDNNDTILRYWPEYSPFAITKDANQYMADNANSEQPFFMLVSIATPHYPHNSAPKKYKEMYPQDSLVLPPNVPKSLEPRVRKELQGYYAHATATDEAIGDMLNQLKELDLLENTIVVFSADHGEMMGAHGVRPFVKQLAWDEALRVPFLIRYPQIDANAGTVVNAPLTTPDILPSLLGLTDIQIPKDVEGENLANLIKNPNPDVDRAALAMGVAPFGANVKDPAYRAIKTKQYTYVKTPEGASHLFDNLDDPFQMQNLVHKKEYAEVQQKLDDELVNQLNEIGDEFGDRDYYLKKWNYIFDEKRKAIDWWSFDEGKGVVQSPKPGQ